MNTDDAFKPLVPKLQIFLDCCWYCRLLAKDTRISDEEIQDKAEEICATPPTSHNKLPELSDPEKINYLNLIQLAVIVGYTKKIDLIRGSGNLAKKSLCLQESENQVDDPVNPWFTTDSKLTRLVGSNCKLMATVHASFMFRNFKKVFNLL